MLKIKLTPTGRKHQRHYRLVVAECRSKLTGKTNIVIGHYHPPTHKLEFDKSLYSLWVSRGATPTSKVAKLCQTS